MGNWLQAVGDSNLPQQTQALTNTALNIRQIQNQEQHQRAIESNQAQQLQLEQQRINSQLELERQQAVIAKTQADKAQKDAELIPFNETLAKLGYTSPEEQEYFKKKAGLNVEEIGGVNYIQRGIGIKLYNELSADPVSNLEVGAIKTTNLNKEIAEISSQLNNPEISGKLKPEQIQELQKQHDMLVDQRTKLANAIKQEQIRLNAKNKDSFETMYDPVKKTYVRVNKYEPTPEGLVPMEIRKEQVAREGKPQIVPEGAVVLGQDGRPVYKNPRTRAAGGGNGGGNGGGSSDKAVTQTVNKIRAWQREHYAKRINQLQQKMWLTPEEQAELDDYRNQSEIADNTINSLLNGEITPKEVRWGGGKKKTIQAQQQPATQKQLDRNTAITFLQKAGGDKNKARQLAKQAGYTF